MPDLTTWEGAPEDTLPKVSKKELLKRYRQRLHAAKKFRQDEGLDKTWRRLVDLYRGRHFSEDDLAKGDRIAINFTFSTVNVIGPSIAINYPKIVVWARSGDPVHQVASAIAEGAVNYWWRQEDVKPEFKRAVKDFLVIGHGWLKIGYRFEQALQPIPDAARQAMFEEQKQQADQFAAQNPHLAADLPTDEDIEGSIPDREPVVTDDRPFVERVSPFDIYVDPEGTTMKDIKWIAQRTIRPLDEVKRDKRYSGSARHDLQSDATMNEKWLDEGVDRKRINDDVKRVTIWEFYDLQRGTLSIFPEMGDKFLHDPIPMPYQYGHPYEMIRNYEVPDKFYPIGDVEQLEPVQHELNETRSQMVNARKRDLRKHVYRRNALSPDALKALKSDRDGEMVPVEDDGVDLDKVVVPIQHGALQPEMYKHSDVIEEDLEKISGVSDYSRGSIPDTRRTATEASIIQDALNARAADKLSIIEDTVKATARKLVQLAQQYLRGEQVARIAGIDGKQYWLNYQPEEIKGEFDFEVEAGSTQPRNDTFRRQQAMQMMQAIGNFIPLGVVNVQELLRYVLQFGFDVKDPSKFINAPQIDPMTGQPALPQGGVPGMPPQQADGGGPQVKKQGTPPSPGKTNSNSKKRSPDALQGQLKSQVGLDLMTRLNPRQGGGALGPGGG